MNEINNYYVVGIYDNDNEIPDKIYKVTASLEEALYVYISYIDNPRCCIGYYHDNKLYSLGMYHNKTADGPGVFKSSVTKESIANFETN